MGFRVWGLGFRVWGLGFRVWDLILPSATAVAPASWRLDKEFGLSALVLFLRGSAFCGRWLKEGAGRCMLLLTAPGSSYSLSVGSGGITISFARAPDGHVTGSQLPGGRPCALYPSGGLLRSLPEPD